MPDAEQEEIIIRGCFLDHKNNSYHIIKEAGPGRKK